MKSFPENFLWGVAYSAHQVEGDNKNNDWWQWEQRGRVPDKSGRACDSWNRWPTDHQLAQDLGCNAFRFSLEWSRIEPTEGNFNEEAIEHYRQILQDLKKRGMKRVVTLWHWTSPLWFSQKYGWHKKEAVDLFARYCQKVVEELGAEIDILISLNEPRVPLNKGYLLGTYPPGKISPFKFKKARENMIEIQKQCYRIVKKIRPEMICCLNEYYSPFYFSSGFEKIKFLKEGVENFYNWRILDQSIACQDVIGIDFYRSFEVGLLPPFVKEKKQEGKKNDIGWGIWPEGIYRTVKELWQRYQKPIFVFENGLADVEDLQRKDFIKDHLKALAKAIEEGIDVRGYFHWSLIDNFEWSYGFAPRFGLCEMNYQTMERQPRKSYYYYQKVIRKNS